MRLWDACSSWWSETDALNIEQRYRFVYKPLVFLASLIPLAWMLCGAFGWLDQSLGPDPVKKLEHFCGKTALNFLMLTLLVTPVRNLAGLPNLLRLRRMLGLFAFFYVVLHFSIYVVLDQELALRSILADVAKRPYITIGFAALLMLIPLAITSTNRMMRRLGRRWQKLHRLIYVIAVLVPLKQHPPANGAAIVQASLIVPPSAKAS